MIFEFLLSIPAYILQALLGVLPTGGSVPTEWISAVSTMWGYVNAFSFIVPINTLLWALGIALTFHLAILGFKLFHWIITKIPFVG